MYTILLLLLVVGFAWGNNLSWEKIASLPAVGGQGEALGVAGPFAGVHNDALIIAGGANFPRPYWQSSKVWVKDIRVLTRTEDGYRWIDGGELAEPVAYGASVSTPQGIVCLGGNNSNKVFDRCFLLTWDAEREEVAKTELPSLPVPCANGAATAVGEKIYFAGGMSGQNLDSAMNNFWMLDLAEMGGEGFRWKTLPSWPGSARALNMTASQHNGYSNCVYVFGGRTLDDSGNVVFLKDLYEFDPDAYFAGKEAWQRKTDAPRPVMAGTSYPVGQSHIFVFGGADGSLFHRADSLRENHPGFPKEVLAYHTITDTWTTAGDSPVNQVTTTAVMWNGNVVLPSGEIKPRVRTPDIWQATLAGQQRSFGFLNFAVILIYLVILVAVGFFFAARNKDTNDFFRGGQRVPWWAAGCSIFATMLSSITFIAVPAKAYQTDWVLMIMNMMTVAVAPLIIFYFLPFFRRIDATSAYEYLEKRFNLAVRLVASASFILFQIGRMAIVMFLPALALAAVTNLSVTTCILIMGGMSIIYCTLGGLEAVIWTDTIQTFVLFGGALLSLVLIMVNLDGGVAAFIETAAQAGKFHLINWDWSPASYALPAFWVVLLGGFFQTLIPYSSDQAVVQRYMSVSDEKKAASAIWTNAVLAVPATLIFFGLGTALFVFYKHNPAGLDPTFQNDAIFPLFIATELPVGIAGLVVAGVFAAAQSTISTSMNSTATALVTDFFRRFQVLRTERAYLNLARILTFLLGAAGTSLALLLVSADIKSVWDSFLAIIGLFGSSICGLFLLGIFTRRVSGAGALIGSLAAIISLWTIQQRTSIHLLLYAVIGVLLTFALGYLASIVMPARRDRLEGLTIYSNNSPTGN